MLQLVTDFIIESKKITNVICIRTLFERIIAFQLIQAVTDAGFDSYEKKLLGITAMQKRLGKSRFDELLTAYIEKPQGKPTLVPESDKRPAMNNAKTDFMEEN